MKNLTATICLTLAVLLFSPTEGFGGHPRPGSAVFQTGLDAYYGEDYATALRVWTPLAEQGDADAQNGMGDLYRDGNGVPQDDETAVKWYTLAAEQGYVDGQFYLGWMYYKGRGVLQDDVYAQMIYAHMWINIVASTGNENGAKFIDMVAEKMTPSQIEEAQTLFRECVAKNYKGC